MQAFWSKNRKAIFLVRAVALLAIIGREGWGYHACDARKGRAEDHAKIADDPQAGVACRRPCRSCVGRSRLPAVADEKYSAGDFKQAQAGYQKAIGSLKNTC